MLRHCRHAGGQLQKIHHLASSAGLFIQHGRNVFVIWTSRDWLQTIYSSQVRYLAELRESTLSLYRLISGIADMRKKVRVWNQHMTWPEMVNMTLGCRTISCFVFVKHNDSMPFCWAVFSPEELTTFVTVTSLTWLKYWFSPHHLYISLRSRIWANRPRKSTVYSCQWQSVKAVAFQFFHHQTTRKFYNSCSLSPSLKRIAVPLVR